MRMVGNALDVIAEFLAHFGRKVERIGFFEQISEIARLRIPRTEALHPRRFFKHCRSETANEFLPAGQYACMFLHEADNEQIFYISPWVKRFVELAEAKGLSVERTVYVEDLPAWLIDEPLSMILRFAARITS